MAKGTGNVMRWPAWWQRARRAHEDKQEQESEAMVSTVEAGLLADVIPARSGTGTGTGSRNTNPVQARVETITPARAQQWLEARNTHNRPLSEMRAEQYARDMRVGNWLVTPDAIAFAPDGRLLNGQHRLRAVEIAGETIQALVAYDVPEGAFRVMDAGKGRTLADALALVGEQNYNALAAAVRIVWHWEQGNLFVPEGGLTVPTHAEQLEVLARHPGLRDSIPKGMAVRKLVGPAIAIGLHYLCRQKDAERADWFFDRLADGEGLHKGDPVMTLRERFQENRASAVKLVRTRQIQLVVKAWNATREKRSATYFKFVDTAEKLTIR